MTDFANIDFNDLINQVENTLNQECSESTYNILKSFGIETYADYTKALEIVYVLARDSKTATAIYIARSWYWGKEAGVL